ncbi:hypothetical protein MMYC01_208980 [Madurella mycetomatis]|uniref:Uncharacterized protein n=1 Tax=Madurella mycetomatis TaxID=100816 RepID=A0A175VT57_9PEZI|nr:hypothetical protein MMYC01_208980 [Madurella mycetomatis]
MVDSGDEGIGAGRSAAKQPESRRVRHYPLDIPHAPFHRYEHRRLSARDIAVHRLMADFMNHTRVPGVFMDSPITPDRHKAFADPCRDLVVLESALFTTADEDTHVRLKVGQDERTQSTIVQGLPSNRECTMGECLLDMAMRHYLESDDAAMRIWMSRTGLMRTPEGPLPPCVNAKATDARRTRREKQVFSRTDLEAKRDKEGKHLADMQRVHWRGLQSAAGLQDELSLYDGGASLPVLRQRMDRDASGTYGARRRPSSLHWALDTRPVMIASVPARPDTNIRFKLRPSWRIAASHPPHPRWLWHAALDVSLSTGRGRNRDSIWATERDAGVPNGKLSVGSVHGGRNGRVRRRCTSEPPPKSFWSALLPVCNDHPLFSKLQVTFPRMTVSELDRRSRRRSLSRTRIEEMFDWNIDVGAMLDASKAQPPAVTPAQTKDNPHPKPPISCSNCASTEHRTSACTAPCGHCGAPNMKSFTEDVAMELYNGPLAPGVHQSPHMASQCPVAAQNRCKCVPFPTFHTAARCGIPCRRDCGGGPTRPGSFQHRNAMTCRARCCMCGLRGSHSGRECRLRRCRCGGTHLGQDCSWHPTCRVPGCDRFLCGLHCRECGSTERPFAGWRCARCVGSDEPPEGKHSGRKLRRRGKKKGDTAGEGDEGRVHSRERDAEKAADGVATPPAVTALTATVIPPAAVLPLATVNERQHRSIIGDPRQRDPVRANR